MRLYLDPPAEQWRLARQAGADRRGRAELANGGGAGRLDPDRAIVATGHQPWFWHPGILVKDMAVGALAAANAVGAFHVVVDHDVHPALQLDLPVRRGEQLGVETITLGPEDAAVPSGCQGSVDSAEMRRRLQAARDRLGADLLVDLQPLIEAVGVSGGATLARQVSAMLAHLLAPYTRPVPLVYSSDLHRLPAFGEFLSRMAGDARACVKAYNQAVRMHPEGDVAELHLAEHRVELPLWRLEHNRPRRRVFVETGGPRPQWVDEQENRIDPQRDWLAPKALLLTALLRRVCCDLFIHGRGGAQYDCITQQWWREWTGEDLAPMAAVSADLYLKLDAPLAQRADVERATWWRHHLPHNLDRALGLDGSDAARKRQLLAHMDDDRDRRRRGEAFAEIHRLNGRWVKEYTAALAEAQERLTRARVGLVNRAVACRRDWCFALYPPDDLRGLRAAVEKQFASRPADKQPVP